MNTPLSPGLRDDWPAALTAPEVLFEDARLLVVGKPPGLVTHPAYKHPDGTLCDYVFARQAARGEERPWLLHRLDRETSGVVLFAKTAIARRALVRQFERRTVDKQYLAITHGAPADPEGEIVAPLTRDPADRRRVIVDPNGQTARTQYRTLAQAGDFALIIAQPLTGRTHQIRAHLGHAGAPIIGDTTYGAPGGSPDNPSERTMLHAWRLALRYPGTGEPWSVIAPVPEDFRLATGRLRLDAALEWYLHSMQEDSCSSPHSIR